MNERDEEIRARWTEIESILSNYKATNCIEASQIFVVLQVLPYLLSEKSRLESALAEAQRRVECAERDLVSVLKLVPVSICRKHCKRASQNCTGWGECNPEWRGLDGREA